METKTNQKLLEYLSVNATEAELLNICLNIEDRINLEKSMHKDLTGFLDRVTPESKPPKSSQPAVLVPITPATTPVVAKVLVGEGLKATSDAVVKRIRKDVSVKIFSHLKNGPDSPTSLANMLNMSTGKMSAIISAMSSRGDLVFDGKLVSLPKPTK
jgi:hypothetical protein